MNVAILIPAAGFGTRMRGVDKLLIEIDGIPLLRRIAARALSASSCVIVTLPDLDGARARALIGLGVLRVAVPDNASGMAASLRRGAAVVPPDWAVMIVPADMPDLTAEDFLRLVKVYGEAPGTLLQGRTAEGRPGHPVLFPADCVPAFSGLTGDQGARLVLQANRDRLRTVALPDNHAETDLDTPEEWARWRTERPADTG